MTTWLHTQRLDKVCAAIDESGPASLVDLGCGDGDLLVRLARSSAIGRLVGMDLCPRALERLRERLKTEADGAGKIEVRMGSMLEPQTDLRGFDCAVLLETIEHIEPERLSKLERAVFHDLRPKTVIVTTPNVEYNAILGVPAHRFRHPGHRFEWPRARFRKWGGRVAGAAGYRVEFRDIGGVHPELGGASQMAVFRSDAHDALARRKAGGSLRA